MTDNILSAVLTFSLLVAGTAAIGSEMVSGRQAAQQRTVAVVTLPTVTIVGHRQAGPEIVTLPTVTIVGHREAVPETVTLAPVVITGRRLAPVAPAPAVTVEALADAPTRL